MSIMMRKYVVINQITPVVFDAPLQHKDMLALGPVTSAGYFFWNGEHVVISGEAFSLNVKNGAHDAALLEPLWKATSL